MLDLVLGLAQVAAPFLPFAGWGGHSIIVGMEFKTAPKPVAESHQVNDAKTIDLPPTEWKKSE